MFFIPKPFFDSSPNEGGTGGTETTPTNTTTTTETKVETPVIPEDIQKELEELRAFKKTVAETQAKTPEQIAKDAEIEKAEFIKYSAENNLMKVDDFSRYETVKQRQDRELVFDSFSKEWKEENPDATDEDVKDAFEYAYHLNSDNEKLKAKGEKIISKEAKELRSPLEDSYNTAKDRFTNEKQLRQDYPNFQKTLTSLIESNLPDKIKGIEKQVGDEKEPETLAVEIDLTKDEKKEIFDAVQKELSKPEVFLLWKNQTKEGKNDMLEKMVAKESKYLINEKKSQALLEKTASDFYERGKTHGTKKGSNIGARQPFAIVRNQGVPNYEPPKDAKAIVDKSDLELRQKINGSRQRV